MRIEFADESLERICTDEAHKLGLPISVIKAARRALVKLEQAPDERTLRNWKSFRYKKLKGQREGQRQIRVNDQYRIVFELLDDERPPVARILEIDDTH
ncbi:type II toxin-antitoxin system RelE/ParE family toxin [Parvibaculum sp.]|jgi:toxin HigB-1|uniref:type II toxin-antitoxin system RelE/ParE family toxin n=1 Tax=Parvibaculum sp. TaxID=2024848 RepID=UPI001B0D92DF|nr:type II toxin-antitoxin system RelE/ParE family toxin [Parvibaculum sp.]MBO6684385.1 type II toxin-antitoxin system RelE/ParE family toxin [Parvibaculum sp.]MBO6904017.1 type II toxin-antitoxin system RelE/ParE family toxin [Parvibaculum sp.]